MSRSITPLARAILGLSLVAGLAACGKQGALEQPAPLFGERARAEYEAQRAAAAPPGAGAPAPPVAGEENTPRTTRDIRDPAQLPSPASRVPSPGAPNPLGAPVNPSPTF